MASLYRTFPIVTLTRTHRTQACFRRRLRFQTTTRNSWKWACCAGSRYSCMALMALLGLFIRVHLYRVTTWISLVSSRAARWQLDINDICSAPITSTEVHVIFATRIHVLAKFRAVWFHFSSRDAMHQRGLCRRAVRPPDCLGVTFVHSVETREHIFKIFSPSGSHTILVFPRQALWRYSDRNWGKNRDFRPISGLAIYDC